MKPQRAYAGVVTRPGLPHTCPRYVFVTYGSKGFGRGYLIGRRFGGSGARAGAGLLSFVQFCFASAEIKISADAKATLNERQNARS